MSFLTSIFREIHRQQERFTFKHIERIKRIKHRLSKLGWISLLIFMGLDLIYIAALYSDKLLALPKAEQAYWKLLLPLAHAINEKVPITPIDHAIESFAALPFVLPVAVIGISLIALTYALIFLWKLPGKIASREAHKKEERQETLKEALVTMDPWQNPVIMFFEITVLTWIILRILESVFRYFGRCVVWVNDTCTHTGTVDIVWLFLAILMGLLFISPDLSRRYNRLQARQKAKILYATPRKRALKNLKLAILALLILVGAAAVLVAIAFTFDV